MRFFDQLNRPYVVEGTRALINGESFDFAFREMVYDLTQTSSLTVEQRDWLIAKRAEAEAINQHLINNELSQHSRTEASLTVVSNATASPWQASSGSVDGNDFFAYNAVRTWTYPDVIQGLN